MNASQVMAWVLVGESLTSQGVLKRVSSAAAALSRTICAFLCSCRKLAATELVIGPSMAWAITGALFSPNAMRRTFLAARMVPTPMVIARRGTCSSPEKAEGGAGEGDEAGAGIARRAGLVEADVPGAADAEDLQVEAARFGNLLFVALAERSDGIGGNGAVGDVDVFRIDVDEAEEVFVHESPV